MLACQDNFLSICDADYLWAHWGLICRSLLQLRSKSPQTKQDEALLNGLSIWELLVYHSLVRLEVELRERRLQMHNSGHVMWKNKEFIIGVGSPRGSRVRTKLTWGELRERKARDMKMMENTDEQETQVKTWGNGWWAYHRGNTRRRKLWWRKNTKLTKFEKHDAWKAQKPQTTKQTHWQQDTSQYQSTQVCTCEHLTSDGLSSSFESTNSQRHTSALMRPQWNGWGKFISRVLEHTWRDAHFELESYLVWPSKSIMTEKYAYWETANYKTPWFVGNEMHPGGKNPGVLGTQTRETGSEKQRK